MPLLETKGAASAQGFGGIGGGSSGPVNYIEDVFSTYLYTGNGSTKTITNGIDLAGKGGLVWIKARTAAQSHLLYSSSLSGNRLFSNSTNGYQSVTSTDDIEYLSTGFTSGSDIGSGQDLVSWTFREQPKFFDVVTYTGNGTNRTISHNLGSVPGCIIVKRTDTSANWQVYHRSLTSAAYSIQLNLTNAEASATTVWNSTAPTSTVFSVGTDSTVNANGGTYVALLFAHNAGGFGLTSTDNVISCGSFTTDGSGNASVTLGYEPQWLLVKMTNSTGNWTIVDNMRGWPVTTISQKPLFPNTSGAEATNSTNATFPTATGFINDATYLGAGNTYIYIAIRRGPMKVPTSGTSVFYPTGAYSDSNNQAPTFGMPYADMSWLRYAYQDSGGIPTTGTIAVSDRLRGNGTTGAYDLVTNSTAAEAQATAVLYVTNMSPSRNNYVGTNTPATGQTGAFWFFRRAPSFFDEVCWTPDGTTDQQIPHNLAAVPELIISKLRSGGTQAWLVYSATLGTGSLLTLNTSDAALAITRWGTPTSTYFILNNQSSSPRVAYLFATVAGVSKVGSYTGTGALQTINCGFTGGARFVLIKRTDSTGDWYVYDSARGISSGNDPYLLLNSTAAEVTVTNYVDTTSVGFQVTAAAPAGLNANGGTYIFLAVS